MIRSLGFLGVRTRAFTEMTALYRDVLGLEPVLERPGAAWFWRAAMADAGIAFIGEPQRAAGTAWNHLRGPDGNVYEIIGPDRSGS